MEKLNNLLDETTILNFRLLWKLVGRYRSHLFVAFLMFAVYFSYSYFSQPIIFSVSVPLKSVEKHTLSSDMSSLLPLDSNYSLTTEELNVAFGSYEFIKSFAREVLKDPIFKSLNFGSIVNGKNLFGTDIYTKCRGNESCMVDRLTDQLGLMYAIEPGLIDKRFVLVVSGLDENTVFELSRILAKAIEKSRIENRKYLVNKEIVSVESLLKETHSVIDGLNGFVVLEEFERINVEITDLKEKVRVLQMQISNEGSMVSALEAKVAENKRTIRKASKIDKMSRAQQVTLRKKLDDVRINIASLINVPKKDRSSEDEAVLKELNYELSLLEKKYGENIKNDNELSDDFGKLQVQSENNFEFDFMVAKNKLLKITMEYEEAKNRLEELNKERILKESTVSRLKSDFDFLKNLESKLMSLKLMSSTMTTDLIFEDMSRKAREFRRSSAIKIFLFCFFLVLFVYGVSIVVRYFFDDKIYSEDDLKNHFKNLDFIGEVPSFDS